MMILRKFLLFIFLFPLAITACSKEDETPLLNETFISPPDLDFTNGQEATLVIGQSDFFSNSHGASALRLSSPLGLDIDARGILRVADAANDRILGFSFAPTDFDAKADFVLGQKNFTGNTANGGGGAEKPSANSYYQPSSVKSADGKLIVTDTYNHRILIYNSIPTDGNPNADVVLGSPDFKIPGPGACARNTFNFPSQAIVANGKLIVADTGNNRVLIYDSVPTESLAEPSLVVGQPNLKTCAPANSVHSASLRGPSGVWSDGTRLIIADRQNHRVLIWDSLPTANGEAADIVLGQATFNSNALNAGGVSAKSLYLPSTVVANPSGQVFISDQGNHRILIWNTFPDTFQQPANVVLGQPDMNTNDSSDAPTAKGLSSPREIIIDPDRLFVADSGNNRILVFVSK